MVNLKEIKKIVSETVEKFRQLPRIKRLDELTTEELQVVYDNNNQLHDEVWEEYEFSEMCYVSDIIDCIRESLSGLEIGFCNHNYINIYYNNGSYRSFVEGVKKISDNYGQITDKMIRVVDITLSKYSVLFDMDYNNKQYDNLEKWLDKQVDNIKSYVLELLNELTQYPDYEQLQNYFVESYINYRMDSSEWYVVKDGYTLHKVGSDLCYA